MSSDNTDNKVTKDISFVNELDSKIKNELENSLREFTIRHTSKHCPIALVTSGGTTADLEINSVRTIDNFSTGLRGSISVEELLKRGYAVIHLQRIGSASPYARILSQILSQGANHGLSLSSFNRLFASNDILEEDDDDQLVQTVLDNEEQQGSSDPWMTDPSTSSSQQQRGTVVRNRSNKKIDESTVMLHRRIINSSKLKFAIQERNKVLQDGRLLTITFKSVEEYLCKLQLCSQSLNDCQSMAILYLAAAVSDFYIPHKFKSKHKIQSKDYTNEEKDGNNDGGDSSTTNDGTFTLKLYPVPKIMGLLKTKWCPNAYICSFKLETDKSILRMKSERAIIKYGCDCVVGNLLQTRYNEVWILSKPSSTDMRDDNNKEIIPPIQDWPLHGVTKPKNSSSDNDVLESMLIDYIVEKHFEYISNKLYDNNESGFDIMLKSHEEIQRKKSELEKELYWKNIKEIALEYGGIILGGILSYVISSTLRRKM